MFRRIQTTSAYTVIHSHAHTHTKFKLEHSHSNQKKQQTNTVHVIFSHSFYPWSNIHVVCRSTYTEYRTQYTYVRLLSSTSGSMILSPYLVWHRFFVFFSFFGAIIIVCISVSLDERRTDRDCNNNELRIFYGSINKNKKWVRMNTMKKMVWTSFGCLLFCFFNLMLGFLTSPIDISKGWAICYMLENHNGKRWVTNSKGQIGKRMNRTTGRVGLFNVNIF